MMLFIGLINLLYGILIISLIKGNLKLKSPKCKVEVTTRVSVIVPFRDEESALEKLANAFLSQDFPIELLEFIFVNDHSTDQGKQKLSAILKASKINYILIDLMEETGKKAALNKGILQASGELILTTDADCWMESLWVKSMVSLFESSHADFIVGPVILESKRNFLFDLFQTEFAALIACTSGAIGINRAFMCNGANLAFRKSLYEQLDPYKSNSNFASGDDVFFLHQAKAMNKRIVFANQKEAIVKTKQETNFNKFLNQRIRWAGKSKHYQDKDTVIIGLIVILMNLGILLTLILVAFNQVAWYYLMGFILYKFTLDYFLLLSAEKWMKLKNGFLNALLLSFIYPIYTIGIALLSLGFKPKWKDRKI